MTVGYDASRRPQLLKSLCDAGPESDERGLADLNAENCVFDGSASGPAGDVVTVTDVFGDSAQRRLL